MRLEFIGIEFPMRPLSLVGGYRHAMEALDKVEPAINADRPQNQGPLAAGFIVTSLINDDPELF